jgi:type I restriction enzyme, S subunit
MVYKLVKLGDISDFVRGINFKPTDVTTVGTSDSIACMRTKNVQEFLDLEDVWAVPKEFVKRPDQVLRTGDILISSANSWNLVGKCCWIPELLWPSSFGGFVSVLRANQDQVDSRYLYRWFSSDRIQNLLRSFGRQTTNISNLDINRCREMSIPLPPIDTQKRITAILDQAEALRSLRRQAIGQLDALARSVFLEMFGDPATNPKEWPIQPMSSLFAESPIFGTMIPPVPEPLGWLSLRVGNIQNWQLDLSDKKYIELSDNLTERYALKDGDLLMARAIASVDHLGKCIVAYPPKNEKWAFDSHLMRLRLSENLAEPEFVRALLMSPGGRILFLGASRQSTVQFNINTKEIATLRIPLPPLALQREFADRIGAIEALKSTHRTSLAKLDELFTSLQHRAFRGEL